MEKDIKQIGNVIETGRDNPSAGRVYDSEGVCPTLGTMQGGGQTTDDSKC